ncbi:hypothetical protein M413DRAFT_377591 [Hebeloma cylindrosporum]|uniref:Uncharacterized protein n=1 Tax=Hebeloma cylindrosporum TaxID=76867 RepID=A0A0C2YTC0_HEBCY|nr:hypothetical protein M413DRAFT_377591 [Hebeloma cylindrosporum h7]
MRGRPVHCLCIMSKSTVSQDPGNYEDAPTEGIRRVLEIATGETIQRGSVLETEKIGAWSYGLCLSSPLFILDFQIRSSAHFNVLACAPRYDRGVDRRLRVGPRMV